jgi:hypothetical protein
MPEKGIRKTRKKKNKNKNKNKKKPVLFLIILGTPSVVTPFNFVQGRSSSLKVSHTRACAHTHAYSLPLKNKSSPVFVP